MLHKLTSQGKKSKSQIILISAKKDICFCLKFGGIEVWRIFRTDGKFVERTRTQEKTNLQALGIFGKALPIFKI